MTDQPYNYEPTPQGWQSPDSPAGYPGASETSPYTASGPSSQWESPATAPNGEYTPPQQPYSPYGGTPTPGVDGQSSAYSSPQDHYGVPQPGANGEQAYASWAPAPQPGIIPLRPLAIGDIFDGTFRAIRSNPTVMFGFAVAVMAVLSLVTAFLTWYAFGSLIPQLENSAAMQGDNIEETAALLSSTVVSSLASSALNFIAIMILTGMLALTVTDAVLGRMTSIEHAWERIRPRVWKLLGLSILIAVISGLAMSLTIGLFVALGMAAYAATESVALVVALVFLLALPAVVILGFFIQVKLLFAPTVLAIENQDVVTSIKRSFALTKGSFWRVLGRLLIITLVTSFIGGVLGAFTGIFQGILPLFVSQALALAVSSFLTGLLTAFLIPVSSAFQTLMYIDERMRKENLAPTLIQASQAQ